MAISEEEYLRQMSVAIDNRDFESFVKILNDCPHLWTPDKLVFYSSPQTVLKITTLHKLAVENFSAALEFYLEKYWRRIPAWNAQYALQRASKEHCEAAVHVLIKSAICMKTEFLSQREAYYFALESRNSDLAEQIVETSTFDVDQPIKSINFSNLNMWHVPLHNAVAHHQLKIAEMLLLRGAKVDCLSNCDISPMMIACYLVYPTIVVLLLRHGSSPNYRREYKFTSEMIACMKKLAQNLNKDRGTAAVNESVPLETGPSRNQSLSDKSNYIVELLVEAGLAKPNKNSFLMQSVVYRHMSPSMRERFKHLPYDIRSLRSLALVQLRNDIRQKCDGIRFFSTVQEMEIPGWVKDMLTLKSRDPHS